MRNGAAYLSNKVQICVTSTLRTSDWVLLELLNQFQLIAPNHNLTKLFHTDWRTGHENDREEEILDHVRRNNVEQYVVVDDRVLTIENFVRIDQCNGFSFRDYLVCEKFVADDQQRIKPELIFM